MTSANDPKIVLALMCLEDLVVDHCQGSLSSQSTVSDVATRNVMGLLGCLNDSNGDTAAAKLKWWPKLIESLKVGYSGTNVP